MKCLIFTVSLKCDRFSRSLEPWAHIYQASQSAILGLSAENSSNVLLLSNLSIKASYQIS